MPRHTMNSAPQTLRSPARNPWPIVITTFFILFFCGLVSFIIFATTQPVDLVRADYYEQEIRYQQQIDRIARARQLEQPMAVLYNPAEQSITISLPEAGLGAIDGSIHLYRPSDSRLDLRHALELNSQGTQRIDTRHLRSGLWKVRVHWTAAGEEYYVDQPIVVGPSVTPSLSRAAAQSVSQTVSNHP